MSITKENIMEAFHFRHACKKFDPARTVSQEDFLTILEAGRLSPSSFGFEPWKFLVVQSPELKEKLYPVSWGAQNTINGASHLVILLARKKVDMLYDSPYITRMMTEIQHLSPEAAEKRRSAYGGFQKNDFDLLESDRAMFDWSCKQTYIALANMLTAAAFLKIDSCPIEGFNRKEVDAVLEKEGLIDLEHFGASVMAGFGYRAGEPQPKTRQELALVVQWAE